MARFFMSNGGSMGISVVEILVSLSIFGISVTSVYAGIQFANSAVSRAGNKTEAAFMIEEGFEGLKHIRDIGWETRIESKNVGIEYCLDFGGGASQREFGLAVGTTTKSRVLHMHFDESEWGGNIGEVKDDSDNQLDGTFGGGTVTLLQSDARNPTYGKAVKLDTDQYVEVIDSTSKLDLASTLSLEAWVKPSLSAPNLSQVILQKGIDNGFTIGTSYFLSVVSSSLKVQFVLYTDSQPIVPSVNLLSNIGLQDDTWSHVVANYDGNTASLYINGVLAGVAPATGLVKNNTDPLYIGNSASTNITTNFKFPMPYIDEVAIYNQALSAEDVDEHYRAGALCKLKDNFQRVVTLRNTCRDASDDILGPELTTCSTDYAGGIDPSDKGTKYADMRIDILAGKNSFSVPTEFYVSHLFTCSLPI